MQSFILEYSGFPCIGVLLQKLENPALRKCLKVSSNEVCFINFSNSKIRELINHESIISQVVMKKFSGHRMPGVNNSLSVYGPIDNTLSIYEVERDSGLWNMVLKMGLVQVDFAKLSPYPHQVPQ